MIHEAQGDRALGELVAALSAAVVNVYLYFHGGAAALPPHPIGNVVVLCLAWLLTYRVLAEFGRLGYAIYDEWHASRRRRGKS